MVFIPDLSTAFIDPFSNLKTLVIIADIYRLDNGKRIRFEDDPRYIAEKAEKACKDIGVDTALFGPEFEFYVLDHISYRTDQNHMEVKIDTLQGEWNSGPSCEQNLGLTVGHHGGYHLDSPFDSSYTFRSEVVRLLEQIGVPVKYHHSENGGPGQVESEVEFATLKEMGDRTMKIKYVLRNHAAKTGKTVTFMPKPFLTECGNGMHIHLNMFNDGKPLFFDENGYSGLSDTALYAIGGVLKHACALMPFTNPSTNSYKRLVPGYEAPVSICYGNANRSAVIRIPGYATTPDQKRFELRSPDAMANPYFAYASMLMAAVDGIYNKIDPVKEGFGPLDVNLYTLREDELSKIKGLPTNLIEASIALNKDHAFLMHDNVFSNNLITNQNNAIKKDHFRINNLPHPAEFELYYNM
jgi:glutamine synthetase